MTEKVGQKISAGEERKQVQVCMLNSISQARLNWTKEAAANHLKRIATSVLASKETNQYRRDRSMGYVQVRLMLPRLTLQRKWHAIERTQKKLPPAKRKRLLKVPGTSPAGYTQEPPGALS